MSALRPHIIAAIIRKDFQTLWPLVLTALLLPLYIGAEQALHLAPQVKGLLTMIGGLAMVALVLTVIQQDSLASPRQDGLTRPTGRANVIVAKILFLSIALAAPVFLATVTNQRFLDHSWGEAWLIGASVLSSGLVMIVAVFVLALITSTLIEAGIIAFSLVIVTVLMQLVHTPGMITGRDGVQWITGLVADSTALVFCAVALVLLLRNKNAFAARAAWIAGAVLVILITRYFPVDAALKLQQILSPKSEWSDKLIVKLGEPCLQDNGKIRTDLAVLNAPEGWRVHLDRATVRHRTPVSSLTPWIEAPATTQGQGLWRLHDASPRPETSGATTQWRYALTLLEPTLSRDVPADGRRRYLAGFGYCEASASSGTVYVGCFKPFARPAALSVSVKGRPGDRPDRGRVDYTPALLEGFGGMLRAVTSYSKRSETLPPPSVVTLTSYETPAHLIRRSVIGAASAKPAPACPRDLVE
jgi:hypothetical protein